MRGFYSTGAKDGYNMGLRRNVMPILILRLIILFQSVCTGDV